MARLKVKCCFFNVHLDVYRLNVAFFFGYSYKQIAEIISCDDSGSVKEIIKMLNDGERPYYDGETFVSNSGSVLIAMPSIPRDHIAHGTLSHEIFHAVEGIMKTIGNEHGGNFNESWAYLIGFLTEEVLLKLSPYYP